MSTLPDALHRLISYETVAEAGSLLFHQGDEVRHLYVVRSGCAHLVRHSETGAVGVMQRATAGSVLAESSIFSAQYHCDAVVVEEARLGRVNMRELREVLRNDSALLEQVTRHLASEVQRVRARVELLSRKTVEERLDGWLALNGGKLPPRGAWRTVAEDMGVSPEALYRELKRRR